MMRVIIIFITAAFLLFILFGAIYVSNVDWGFSKDADPTSEPEESSQDEHFEDILTGVGFDGWTPEEMATDQTSFVRIVLKDAEQVREVEFNGMKTCWKPSTISHPLMVKGLDARNRWTDWEEYWKVGFFGRELSRVAFNAPEIGLRGNPPMALYVIQLPKCLKPGTRRTEANSNTPHCSAEEIKPELDGCDNEKTKAIFSASNRRKIKS